MSTADLLPEAMMANDADATLVPHKRATSAVSEASSKRTAQNRAAQRAFRERKQQYLQSLEEKVKELTERQERTERENEQLRKCISTLQSENQQLKDGKFTYEAPVDFEKAITDLFDSSQTSGLDLTSTFGLQQAAVNGADLTQPGAMDRIKSQISNTNASPQSVPVMHSAGSQPALNGVSNDIFNGIQMLASNQNISTGSFMDHLFDNHTTKSTDSGYGITAASRSPTNSASVATPSDMFVPLNHIGLDAFKNYQGDAMNFASLIQSSSQASAGNSQGAPTPSLSELLSFSPPLAQPDGLFNLVSTSTDTSSTVTNIYPALNSLTSQPTVDSLGSNEPKLPPYLMAYRNPDPIGVNDDGDQLEKLLLSSMYSAQQPQQTSVVANATVSSPKPSQVTAEQLANHTGSSSPGSATEQQPPTALNLQCTCRNCEESPCAPCPKHGSPADLSEEMREIAPQMLNTVCSGNNRLADEELNDLCSLMFKHAKCSEVQKRVEMAREKLKNDSELELFNTKMKLAKQYGLK
ncbi:DNA-binding transcription factor yap1 [Coemansia sp. RSA 1821]|nr:DNA-binding transcription factor yap1 [Coemansia sp. RSA 1086]KAJ1748312.1 DNA-binding transcription factor yap1 [Coemansia sp. RSA 1821]KAJ2671428.1 DNA-binding transcription factor yap1 [Coemansia sp. RSA 1085]